MLDQHRTNKLCRKYCEKLKITEDQFHRGLKTPGVTLLPDYVLFHMNKIEAQTDWDPNLTKLNNFKMVLSNFKIIWPITRGVFYTNAIFPHSASTKANRIGRELFRRLCVGSNDMECYSLLKKFELQGAIYLFEDIISKISKYGYWYPQHSFSEFETLEFFDCIICKNRTTHLPQSTCSTCSRLIKIQKLESIPPQKLRACGPCGALYSKKEWCKKCCPSKH